MLAVATPADAAPPTCSSSTFTVSRVSSPTLYVDVDENPKIDSAYEGYEITNSTGAPVDDVWVTSGGFTGGSKIHLATYESGQTQLGAIGTGASKHAYFYLTADATTGSESHTISVFTTRPDLAVEAACTQSVSMNASSDISASSNTVSAITPAPTTPELGGNLTITVNGGAGTITNPGTFVTSPASYASWRADAFKLVGTQLNINSTTYNNQLYWTGLNGGGAYTATFTFAVVGTTTTSTTVSPMSHINNGQLKHTDVTSLYRSLSPIPPPTNSVTLSAAGAPALVASSGGTATYTVTVDNAGTVPVTLSDLVIEIDPAATFDTSSAVWDGSGIADPFITGSTLTFVGQFTAPAGGSADLTFDLTLPAIAGPYAISAIGHTGAVQIDASISTTTDTPATASVTVLAGPPTVTNVAPSTGNTAGSTLVTITGTEFVAVSAVKFGTDDALAYYVISPTTIVALAPPGSVGTVDVTVTTPSGTSATTSSDEYTFANTGNTPPEFTSATVNTTQNVLVGSSLTSLAATDDDSDPLNYTLITGSLPSGVTLNANGSFTGAVSGPATTTAVVAVDDGNDGADITTLLVRARSVATVTITGAPTITTNDDTPTIAGTTTAPEGSTVTVDIGLQSLPTTVATGGSWSVTTASLALGSHPFTATASDTYGELGDASATVEIVTGNVAPVYTSATTNTSQALLVGSSLTGLQATDADDDPLTFSLTSGSLPTGIALNANGSFSGTATTAGSTTASITVSDGNGGTVATSLEVVVRDTAAVVITGAPVITTTDATPTISGTTTAPVGATLTVLVAGQSLSATVATGGVWSVTAANIATGTHSVTATASDVHGDLGSTTASVEIVPLTAPGPPGTPVAVPGDGQVNVSWTPPGSDGGSPVTDYVVTPYIGGVAQTPVNSPGTGTSIVISGLTNGTTYTFTVRAINAQGIGVHSTMSNAATPRLTPTKGGTTDVTPTGQGYWALDPDGSITAFGDATTSGSMAGQQLNSPMVGFTTTSASGYLMAGADGGVFAFGDAPFLGSMAASPLNSPVVSVAATPTGTGYWLAGADGGVFAFGDAGFYGNTVGMALNEPVIGLSPTFGGTGYWLFASDGGVFCFGDAPFYGNTVGLDLNQPITGLAPTPSGRGYWLAGADGGVFAFGDAQFFGSTGSQPPGEPIVGIIGTKTGNGYSLVKADHSVINFGDASL